MKRLWGVSSVFLPPVLAGLCAFRESGGERLDVVGALVCLWWVMSATLVIRYLEVSNAKERTARSPLEQLDVLTSGGRAIMWTGLAAVVLSTKTGWASLSVVGMLGIGADRLQFHGRHSPRWFQRRSCRTRHEYQRSG